MKRRVFSCGDRVYVINKNDRRENGIVCASVDTTNEKTKVRVVMENGSVMERPVDKIILK